MEHILIVELQEEYERLSRDGFRVLAIATKDVSPKGTAAAGRTPYTQADECDLVLNGYVAFLDPPKETAAAAIKVLQQHGVTVKVVTGDNDLVARKICKEVGLSTDCVLLGADVQRLDDDELVGAAEHATLFARVSPADKQRIIKALQAGKHTVGFMGDGINDAPALRAADVGISVDTAVDIAKESADMILLEKSLLVLEQGVMEGRKVFANILKYIRMGASSNFGNMFSVLGASVLVPYLPMTPIQILSNNLLYDISQTAIPTDDVDPEQIAKPRPWDIGSLTKFILFIGPCSSVFDYTTFFLMLYVFHTWSVDKAPLFQTGWFVESLLTQTLIIHVIRTTRIPFIQSRASWPLIATTVCVMAVGVLLPTTGLGSYLGFVKLPALYWPFLVVTLLAYMGLTQAVKTWLLRRGWI
jgi:Mg2+-importing ATPase